MRQVLLMMTWATALGLGGCQPKPEAPATGQYGSLTNSPRAFSAVAKEPSAAGPWTNGALAVVESALSPATLFHANTKSLAFFVPDAATGLGAPSYLCFSTQQGPKIFKPGEKIDPARMRESWFVVWWVGARGWTAPDGGRAFAPTRSTARCSHRILDSRTSARGIPARPGAGQAGE